MVFYIVKLIIFDGESFIECFDDIYIFDVVEEVGLDLFYFCCVGVCFICVGKIIVGSVD